MPPPPLGAPDGSMLPDRSVDNELAARMDNLELLNLETKEILKTIGIVAGVGIGVGALAVAAAPLGLAAAGFTSSGVAAGSIAAAYQATLGGIIAKGSVFAALQSFGAAGLPAMAQATTAVVGGGAGASVAAACRKFFRRNKTAEGDGGEGDGGEGDGGEGEAATEPEAANAASEDLKDEKDVCAETCTKSTEEKPSEKAGEQEPSHQNMENEEAAKKRDSFRK